MKRFTIPCVFGELKAPFHIYVGHGPSPGCHPLKYQTRWLESERNGQIPPEVIESFQKLLVIATDNKVDFEELVVYALGTTKSSSEPGDSGATPSDG